MALVTPAHKSDGRDEPVAREVRRLRVCLASLTIGRASETFIRAHRDLLPFHVEPVEIGAWDKPVLRTQAGWEFPRTGLFKAARRANHEKLRALMNARFRRAFARWLRLRRIDCVLAEYGPTGVALMEGCLVAGVPFVVHFHGFDAHTREVVVELAPAYRRMFEHAAAVVAVSQTMRDRLTALGCPAEKLHVIPCGANVEPLLEAPLKREKPPEAPVEFLFVGRFVNKKGPIHLLLSFQRCVQQMPGVRLTMIGDGPLWEATRELCTALGLDRCVSFPGALAHERVRELMIQSDCYTQHSIEAHSGDSEGSPVAVVEASAAGLPVIATRHAGIVESVIHGETGLLVAEGDIAAMSDAMIRIGRDAALRQRLGEAGRAHVSRHFSAAVCTRALAHVLELSTIGAGT